MKWPKSPLCLERSLPRSAALPPSASPPLPFLLLLRSLTDADARSPRAKLLASPAAAGETADGVNGVTAAEEMPSTNIARVRGCSLRQREKGG